MGREEEMSMRTLRGSRYSIIKDSPTFGVKKNGADHFTSTTKEKKKTLSGKKSQD